MDVIVLPHLGWAGLGMGGGWLLPLPFLTPLSPPPRRLSSHRHPRPRSPRPTPSPSSPPISAPPPPAPPSSHRLPSSCWSHDKTVTLIDSYKDKWYSLHRGNLKAAHWQDVTDAVARRCTLASPSKTAVQCRHKMEKLRK
ncbi:Myb/SANT-like DNA-binding domain 4 [Dillenia turbinata]|uniref:Myb/SANT-like DNA-binding domain 4 n=1 Tax=Dillenia turbinata TaxID=194707 RepID=A0AAN8UXI2_9MAGN